VTVDASHSELATNFKSRSAPSRSKFTRTAGAALSTSGIAYAAATATATATTHVQTLIDGQACVA
jgi:hypothetical protein